MYISSYLIIYCILFNAYYGGLFVINVITFFYLVLGSAY
jgi:hypothetical protein